MKSLLAFGLFFAMSASASLVTKTERELLKTAAHNIMLKFGAELELSPKVLDLKVVDRQGSVVEVEFNGIEWGPYEYKCNFAYDFSVKSVIAGSDYCN